MFSQTLLLILGGCLLGAIQLLAGLALGVWLRRPDGPQRRHDLLQASAIAQRLAALADEMSSSALEHRSRLDQASQLLTSAPARTDESLAELAVDVIGEVVRANQTLQTKLESAETRLEEQAIEIKAHMSRSLTDPLTGLPNRRAFNNRLEEQMAAWNRRGQVFSLLLLDVDHFKKLNDAHGHLAGDAVLAALGRALRGAVRREDAVARYGGEEFAILLPSTSLDQATCVAQKVRSAVARIVVNHHGQKIAVTSSGGLAMIEPQEPAESLIHRADAALYAAKAAGRDCTFLHDGTQVRPADDFQTRLIELIGSDGFQPLKASTAAESLRDCEPGCGSSPSGEEISAELAKTCDELRQLLLERSGRPSEEQKAGSKGQGT